MAEHAAGGDFDGVLQFIVEAYQLFKARACGADAVLLIAAVLPNTDLAYLIKSVKKLGMQTLIEVCCHVCFGNLPWWKLCPGAWCYFQLIWGIPQRHLAQAVLAL